MKNTSLYPVIRKVPVIERLAGAGSYLRRGTLVALTVLLIGCASGGNRTPSPATAQATGDWHCAAAPNAPTWDCERKQERNATR